MLTMRHFSFRRRHHAFLSVEAAFCFAFAHTGVAFPCFFLSFISDVACVLPAFTSLQVFMSFLSVFPRFAFQVFLLQFSFRYRAVYSFLQWRCFIFRFASFLHVSFSTLCCCSVSLSSSFRPVCHPLPFSDKRVLQPHVSFLLHFYWPTRSSRNILSPASMITVRFHTTSYQIGCRQQATCRSLAFRR